MKTILFLSTILLVTSCYHNERAASELIIRKSKEFRYEIEIPIHYEGRGNIHRLDASKYSYNDSDWIYVNSRENKVSSGDMVLTYERDKTKYPHCQSNLRGFVYFKNDSILIRLIIPHYIDEDNTPDEWLKYEYNGNYKLKRE